MEDNKVSSKKGLSQDERWELNKILNKLWGFLRTHSDGPFSIKDGEYDLIFTDGKTAVRVELRGK